MSELEYLKNEHQSKVGKKQLFTSEKEYLGAFEEPSVTEEDCEQEESEE